MFHNVKVLIIVGGLVLIVILVIFLRLTGKQSSPEPTTEPSTSQVPFVSILPNQTDYSSKYIERSEEALDNQKEILDKNQKVGLLLEKMPYDGTNFEMKFDFESANFVITINKANRSEAEEEFNRFLRNQGIENRDWIDNLVIIEQ